MGGGIRGDGGKGAAQKMLYVVLNKRRAVTNFVTQSDMSLHSNSSSPTQNKSFSMIQYPFFRSTIVTSSFSVSSCQSLVRKVYPSWRRTSMRCTTEYVRPRCRGANKNKLSSGWTLTWIHCDEKTPGSLR